MNDEAVYSSGKSKQTQWTKPGHQYRKKEVKEQPKQNISKTAVQYISLLPVSSRIPWMEMGPRLPREVQEVKCGHRSEWMETMSNHPLWVPPVFCEPGSQRRPPNT